MSEHENLQRSLFMINIQNQQNNVAVDIPKLQQDASKILAALNYADFDLTILLTSEPVMQKFNRDYRKKDQPTDILSFPFYPDLKAGERILAKDEDDQNLGDLILCPLYILNDLDRWQKSFEERLQILLVHGICHLLGYDHIKDEDYLIMKEQEDWLIAQINT
jgi:probable rRNA maturation factor